jgi:hypothetical protein
MTAENEKMHVSFRLNANRLERLRKLGEKEVPALSLTYMVEKAIAECLEKHEPKAKAHKTA